MVTTKPTVSIKPDTDMYQLNRVAVAALRKENLHSRALELEERGLYVQSFYEMLNLTLEFVSVEQDG